MVLLASLVPWAVRPQTKALTLAWDSMPDGEKWTEVRIYEGATVVATAPCQPGPPIVCPTQVTFNITRAPHVYAARSYDGFFESDDSNTVTIAPPGKPGNLRKQ